MHTSTHTHQTNKQKKAIMKYEWGHIYRHSPERRSRVATRSEVEWMGWRESEKIVSRRRKDILDTLRNSCERSNTRKKWSHLKRKGPVDT